MVSPRDLALVEARREDANRIGVAVQLAMLRHPGFGFTLEGGAPPHLVAFVGAQTGVNADAFKAYAARAATASVHAREAEAASGLRQPTNADLPMMIEAGTLAAWSTDRAVPIVSGIIAAIQRSCITLPASSVIERVGIASRSRARKRAYDALLADVSDESIRRTSPLRHLPELRGGCAYHTFTRHRHLTPGQAVCCAREALVRIYVTGGGN